MPIYKTGKTKNGKLGYRVRVNYTDASGKYRVKTQVVYGAPEAKFAEQRMIYELGQSGGDSNITVQLLAEKYLENKKSEVRETTLIKTSHVLRNHILPTLGNIKLENLDVVKLQKWKTDIAEKEIAVSTKKNIYGEFRALLNFAVKMEYISKNPLIKLGNFKKIYFDKPQETLHYYTAEQFKKYICAAKSSISTETDRACYVFFNIAYYTGMRKGEINALKWSDIEDDIINIRRSVAQKVKGKSIVETPPKNKSSYRSIQMPQKLVAILNEHKQNQMKNKSFSEDYRVCGGVSCISDTNIDIHNRRYADTASLPRIRVHDFRHSHASLLANEGINIQEIARRLGHSKIEITWNTYSHLYPREEERAIKVLDNI